MITQHGPQCDVCGDYTKTMTTKPLSTLIRPTHLLALLKKLALRHRFDGRTITSDDLTRAMNFNAWKEAQAEHANP